jgi:hypothetical protein
MGGAALTTNVHHLVLYEPSLGLTYPSGAIDRIEALLDAGDRPDPGLHRHLSDGLTTARGGSP